MGKSILLPKILASLVRHLTGRLLMHFELVNDSARISTSDSGVCQLRNDQKAIRIY